VVVVAAVNDGSAAGTGRPLGAAGRIAVAGRGKDHGTTQSAEGVDRGAIEPLEGLAWTPDRCRQERQRNGDGGTRTLNPRVANAVLCQLSYVPEHGSCPADAAGPNHQSTPSRPIRRGRVPNYQPAHLVPISRGRVPNYQPAHLVPIRRGRVPNYQPAHLVPIRRGRVRGLKLRAPRFELGTSTLSG
jgi:hypothetical protein